MQAADQTGARGVLRIETYLATTFCLSTAPIFGTTDI